MSLDLQKFMAMWNPWPERMEDTVYGIFGDKFAVFNDALISGEALVAGGSVLAPYIDGKISDIDIYIHRCSYKFTYYHINNNLIDKSHECWPPPSPTPYVLSRPSILF